MNICKAFAIIVRIVLTITLIATPLFAQRRRAPAPKSQPPAQAAQPAPTFDSILAAESYRIYVEVRGVGQLLRSPGVNDVLDPMVKLTSPPKELKTLVKWLNSQADDLMSSRLMVASMPSRPKLPQVLIVIEFDSAESARKFEPKLKSFLPQVLPPTPPAAATDPTRTSTEPANTSAEPEKISGEPKVVNDEAKPQDAAPTSPPPPQLVVKQAGPLLILSESAVSLKTLRPTGSKPLTEDSNFRQAHSRFSSDSVFVYVDVASFQREDQERRKAFEEQQKQLESEIASQKKAEEEAILPEGQASPEAGADEFPPPDVVVSDSVLAATASPPPDEPKGQLSGGGGGVSFSPVPLSFLTSFLFTGPPKWPDALGVAINFEADSYVVRALLINDPETKGSIVPFMPQLASGPPLSLEASSIFPADTKLLISASLDYTQIYETATKSMMLQQEEIRASMKAPIKVSEPESPLAPFEAKLGIKIKEDLLPLLGNEIAISVPVSMLGLGPSQPSPPPASPNKPGEEADPKAPKVSESDPIIAIAIKDKESVRALIPKIIDGISFKGASMIAQSEKRGETELVSYAGVISYALIGNFLVISPDNKAVRHVVDSYLNHQTLGSDSRFRDSTRWQPRQMLAQVYMPTELMESYYELLRNPVGNNKMRDFLSQLNPIATPVTYAVSDEGIGPLHELHLPKNFVMFMIAGIASESHRSPMATNEAVTKGALSMITNAETTYQSGPGKGSFGTLEQLVEQNLVHKDLLDKYGYKIEITVAGAKFEATAIPVEYGKTGMMSFFVDETGVVRGADRGGAPASATDKPVQ